MGGRLSWTSSLVQTYTGLLFDPFAPRAEDVCVEDIAHALSNICRYGGHGRFYSVAEHCVLVSIHCPPEYAREGLMHDGTEAYIGDVVRPLKRHPDFAAYLKVEEGVAGAIAERFGLRTDPVAHAAWKAIDDRILVDEVREATTRPDMYRARSPWFAALEPVGAEILCYPPPRAEALFLARFGELFPEWCPPDLKVEVTR